MREVQWNRDNENESEAEFSNTAPDVENSGRPLTAVQVDIRDTCCVFGLSIAASLRTLPPAKQEYAKLKIQQVLYETQFQ